MEIKNQVTEAKCQEFALMLESKTTAEVSDLVCEWCDSLTMKYWETIVVVGRIREIAKLKGILI